MANELTITIGGKKDAISPESVIEVLKHLTALLNSVDSAMWAVGNPRHEWLITAATMKSPITFEFTGTPLLANDIGHDVPHAVVAGIRTLELPNSPTPEFYGPDALVAAEHLAHALTNGVSFLRIAEHNKQPVDIKPVVAETANRLLKIFTEEVREEIYTSIRGSLRQLTIDPREGMRKSGMQIIDEESNQLIPCSVTPTLAQQLGPLIGKTVVLYGLLQTTASGRKKIVVDDYRPTDEDPPSIYDLHEVGVDITGKKDAVSFVRRLRGEG